MRRIDFVMAIEVAVSTIQKEVDYSWFGEYSSIFPAPLIFSLPPPTRIYLRNSLSWEFGVVNVVPGCVKATFGSWMAFYGNICDIILILCNVLGLFGVGRRQERLYWMIGYGGYIEGCVDVVGSNKGTNNWGWRCKFSCSSQSFCW